MLAGTGMVSADLRRFIAGRTLIKAGLLPGLHYTHSRPLFHSPQPLQGSFQSGFILFYDLPRICKIFHNIIIILPALDRPVNAF